MNYKVIVPMLLSLAGPLAAQSDKGEDVGGGWKLQTETDAMTDDTVARLLKSEGGKILAFKCDKAEPRSVYLHLIGDKFIGEQIRSKTRSMMIRFDAEEPGNIDMMTDGRSAMTFSFPIVQMIARKMETAHSVKFRVYGYDSDIHDFSFDVTGSGPALAKLFQTCKSEL